MQADAATGAKKPLERRPQWTRYNDKMIKLPGLILLLLGLLLAGCTNDKNAVKTPVPPPPPRSN